MLDVEIVNKMIEPLPGWDFLDKHIPKEYREFDTIVSPSGYAFNPKVGGKRYTDELYPLIVTQFCDWAKLTILAKEEGGYYYCIDHGGIGNIVSRDIESEAIKAREAGILYVLREVV